MNYKKLLFILISIFLSIPAFSQIYGTHNFYTHNLFYYNPAHTGDAGNFVAFMSYRNHLVSIPGSPKTATFGLHSPISKKMSLGGMLKNQTEGLLNYNSARLDYSFRTQISKYQSLSFGINFGYLSKSLNTQDILVFDPLDPIVVDNYNMKPIIYAGAGLSFNLKNFEFDFAIPILYRTSNDTLTRYLAYTSYFMKINNNWFLKPSLSAVYVKQENLSGQADLCLFFKNIFWIEGGYKTTKSIVLSTGFNISKIGIAYSYETNSTAISNIGGSTHEIMLTYGFGGRKNNPLKDTIPIIADSLVDNRMKHTIGNKTYEEYIMSNNYGFYNDVLDLTDSMRREEVKKIEIQKIKEKQDSIIVADSIKQNPVQQLSQSEYDILKRGIHFDLNSAVLSKASRNYLDSVVVLMNINQKIKILITGFTCDLGSKEANEKYSKMRADAVKYYLESKGIASDRITTDSKADAQPVVPNTSEINREQNRRIDFSILRE